MIYNLFGEILHENFYYDRMGYPLVNHAYYRVYALRLRENTGLLYKSRKRFPGFRTVRIRLVLSQTQKELHQERWSIQSMADTYGRDLVGNKLRVVTDLPGVGRCMTPLFNYHSKEKDSYCQLNVNIIANTSLTQDLTVVYPLFFLDE